MKYVVLLMVVFIGIVSCQKELTADIFNQGIDSTVTPRDTGKMEADIDGVRWVANDGVSAVFTKADSVNPPMIIISGSRNDSTSLLLSMVDSGQYVYKMVSGDSANNTAWYDDTANSYFSNIGVPGSTNVGSISVTSIDTVKKTISGRFAFKVYSASDTTVKTFTNGLFTNVPYVVIGDSNLVSTDTFSVKYNDTLMTARPGEVIVGSSGNSIGIGAKDVTGKRNFDVTFPLNITVGSYTFDSTAARFGYYKLDSTYYRTKTGAGTLQILENNANTKRIRGNFSFVGYSNRTPVDSARLTEGYFSIEAP